MALSDRELDSFADIQFYLLAQYVPIQPMDWMFDGDAIHSSFGMRQALHIIAPPRLVPWTAEMANQTLVKEIGGFLGITATKFTARCMFEKNQYFTGELARFTVELDNTMCDKPIKSVKIKVCRKHMINSKPGSRIYGTDGGMWKKNVCGRVNIAFRKYD